MAATFDENCRLRFFAPFRGYELTEGAKPFPSLMFMGEQPVHSLFNDHEIGWPLHHRIQTRRVARRSFCAHEDRSRRRSQLDDVRHFFTRQRSAPAFISDDQIVNPGIKQGERLVGVPDRFHRISQAGQEPLGGDTALRDIVDQ